MDANTNLLAEQVIKLSQATPDNYLNTMSSLAQQVLMTYQFDRLSLIPRSSLLLSRGEFYSASLDKAWHFQFEKYHLQLYKRYTQLLDNVKLYRAFNSFDLMQTTHPALEQLRVQGVRYHVMIPISSEGQIWGAITLSSFTLINRDLETDQIARQLQALGNLWLCFWKQIPISQAYSLGKQAQLHSIEEKIIALPKRQREVLTLLNQGLTMRECAAQLFISPRTVESHKYRILQAFDVRNQAELQRLTNVSTTQKAFLRANNQNI